MGESPKDDESLLASLQAILMGPHVREGEPKPPRRRRSLVRYYMITDMGSYQDCL